MAIEKALGSKDIDIESLVQDWWELYNDATSVKELIELIFHTAGYKSFKFVPQDFPSKEIENQMMEQGDVPTYLDILDDEKDYSRNYGLFFVTLLNYRHRKALYEEQIIKPLLNSVFTLIDGCWDSYRMTAVITGTEIMSAVFKEKVSLQIYLDNISNSSQSSDAAEREQRDSRNMHLNILEFEIFSKVYRPSTKDVSSDIRKVSIIKLSEWSVYYPQKILEKKWHLYILRSIRDSNSENREIAFEALFNLFRREVDEVNQRELFYAVKSDLIVVLNSKSDLVAVSLKIFCSVIQYTGINLTTFEREQIFLNVYDPRGNVACFGGLFLYRLYFSSLINIPEGIINGLIQFNNESKYKSYELLIDTLYIPLKNHLKWEDWHRAISKATPEETICVIDAFSAYVAKAIVDYVPKYRRCYNNLTKEEMTKNMISFTNYFSPHFPKIMSDNKIKFQPNALYKIAKLPQYFTQNKHLENLKEIVDLMCEVMQISIDKRVIMECASSLDKMATNCETFDPSRLFIVKFAVKNLADTISSDFTEYLDLILFYENAESIEYRMLALSMFHDFDDYILWKIAVDKLENASANNLREKLIIMLMSILFQLLVRKYSMAYKRRKDQGNEISLSNLVEMCISRYSTFRNVVHIYLQSISDEVSKTAFSIGVLMLEKFGPNSPLQDESCSVEDENFIQAIVDCTKRRLNLNCHSNRELSLLKQDECCDMLNKTCSLISSGVINIVHLESFIVFVGMNPLYDKIIINTLKKHMTVFPKQGLMLSATVFNSLISLLEINTEQGVVLEDSVSRLQKTLEFLLNVNKIEKELMRYVALHMYEHVVNYSMKNSFKQLLVLLKVLTPIISTEDIPFLISSLKYDQCRELEEYIQSLEQVLQKNSPEK